MNKKKQTKEKESDSNWEIFNPLTAYIFIAICTIIGIVLGYIARIF